MRIEDQPGKRHRLEQPAFGHDLRGRGALRQLNDLLHRFVEQHDVDRCLHAFRRAGEAIFTHQRVIDSTDHHDWNGAPPPDF